MINVRGSRADYDRLAAQGLEGWGYDDVLRYFRRLEASWRREGLFHGKDGPIGNVPVGFPDGFFEALRDAASGMGLGYCEDQNGADQHGISRIELTTNSGRRASTARAYLRPAMRRSNLTVRTQAQTTRIIVEGRRAVGVEFVQHGRMLRARADREVVVSAGTYNSPALLMLSGIGPADHLRALGIEVAQDLPGVGQNLQEHPNLLNIYRTRGKLGLTDHLRVDRATIAVLRWALLGDGPFATAGTSANLFLRSEPGLDRPDVQIIAMPVHQHADLWFPGVTRPPVHAFTARVGILHAQSRGWVRLRSSNPLDYPRIQFNLLTESSDLRRMVEAVKTSRDLFDQAPMEALVEGELLPGADFQSDDALAAAIRQQAEHRHHAVGTCRMGLDADAVVDAQLRVVGIERLRVADASVLPDDPSGNTNVPTMMVGEKAVDLLRGKTLERVGGQAIVSSTARQQTPACGH
jgi:choline dehydrogenase